LKFLVALKKQPSIKLMLHSRLAAYEEARDPSIIHASDLMKEKEYCPREWALYDLTKTKPQGQFIGTALRATFAHGRDMEARLRNDWLGDVIVGRWDCSVCHHLHPAFGKKPKVDCQFCKHYRWEYYETRFHCKTSGISGGIDAIVDVGQMKHRILEIKSIDKDQFKELVAPLAEHRFRTSLYLRLAEESELDSSNSVNVQEAHILYVSKSFGFKDTSMAEAGIKDAPFSPFKEFIVSRDDSLVATSVNKATALTVARTAGGVPCGVCVNALTKRAQSCDAKKHCWSGQFPHTITWLENGKPKHEGKYLPIGCI